MKMRLDITQRGQTYIVSDPSGRVLFRSRNPALAIALVKALKEGKRLDEAEASAKAVTKSLRSKPFGSHATTKKSPRQLDREIAEVLAGWGVDGGTSLTDDRVAKLTDDHINEIYRDAQARGDMKTAKLAAKVAYAYDKPDEKIAALAAHLAGKKGRRTSHATKKSGPRSARAAQKRYRLVIAGPTGRYIESEFTATKDEALAQARRELEQGAVYVRVDTDVDHLRRTYTPVTEMRK